MCFLRMLMISPIKGHGLVTRESALACRHDFFGLLSILKQCLNQLPTSRNQETPFKKKNSRFSTSSGKLENVAGSAILPCQRESSVAGAPWEGSGCPVCYNPCHSSLVPLASFIHQQQLLGLQDSCIHNSRLQFIVHLVPKE